MSNTAAKMLKYCENYKVFSTKVFPDEKADTDSSNIHS